MTSITDVDLTSRAFQANPYPTYARLRAEAPVCRVKLPDGQTAWIVTRYDDAVNLLKDPRFGNDRKKIMTPEQAARLPWTPGIRRPLSRVMINVDAPDHTRLRALVHKAFTPGLVANMLEVMIAGVTIARGEMVHAMLGSANRDERQFECPDDLDITREPNRHLAFGQGVHYCVGAPLARLEGQIAINTLLRRFPEIKLAVPPHTLRRRRGLGLRGLVSLPVAFSQVRPRSVLGGRSSC